MPPFLQRIPTLKEHSWNVTFSPYTMVHSEFSMSLPEGTDVLARKHQVKTAIENARWRRRYGRDERRRSGGDGGWERHRRRRRGRHGSVSRTLRSIEACIRACLRVPAGKRWRTSKGAGAKKTHAQEMTYSAGEKSGGGRGWKKKGAGDGRCPRIAKVREYPISPSLLHARW